MLAETPIVSSYGTIDGDLISPYVSLPLEIFEDLEDLRR